jgi:hypothetical protein
LLVVQETGKEMLKETLNNPKMKRKTNYQKMNDKESLNCCFENHFYVVFLSLEENFFSL